MSDWRFSRRGRTIVDCRKAKLDGVSVNLGQGERGSAGPAVRPCGFSGGAGSLYAAKWEMFLPACDVDPITMLRGRAVQTTSRWKNRRAGERALRYFLLWHVAPPRQSA